MLALATIDPANDTLVSHSALPCRFGPIVPMETMLRSGIRLESLFQPQEYFRESL